MGLLKFFFLLIILNSVTFLKGKDIPLFWQASLGYRYLILQQASPTPDQLVILKDANFSLLDDFLIGLGPFNWEKLFFNVYYLYGQDWESTASQVGEFWNQWFSSPSMSSFIFPTRSMLRTHEFVADMRIVIDQIQFGYYGKLAWNRIGSTLLGEELERTQTSSVGELFAPYLSYRWGSIYHGQFSMPFRTEIYREARRLSNKSYSFDAGGRGVFMTYRLRNGFLIPPWRTIIKVDLELQEFRYASVQYDKRWFMIENTINLPFLWKSRVEGIFGFRRDSYLVEIPKIPESKKKPEQNDNPTVLYPRVDNIFSYGAQWFIYFANKWMFVSTFRYIDLVPPQNLQEFTNTQLMLSFKLSYSFPDTSFIGRRTQRFNDNIFIESQSYD
jgi:hypothetical protein